MATLPAGFEIEQQPSPGLILPEGFEIEQPAQSERFVPSQRGGRGIFGRAQEEKRLAQVAALPPEQRALVEDIGPFQAAAIGAGRGLTTIARGVGLAEPEDPQTTKAIEALRLAQPLATPLGEVAGEAAPFIAPALGVAAIPATAARVLGTAALGAAEGTLIAKGEGRDVGTQLLSAGIGGTVAGALELGLPIFGRIGGKLIRKVLGKAPEGAVVDATGKPSQELVEALEKSGQSFDDLTEAAVLELKGEVVDPEQAARKALLESQGIVPTRAQITRDAGDFQAQQEAAKTPGRVRSALEAQEAALTTRFDNKIVETGGEAVTPTSTVTDSLVNKASVLDKEISDLYKRAREAAPGKQNVRFAVLANKLRSLAPSDRATGGAIRSIAGDLQEKGVLDKNFKVIGRVDVETAEDVRKLMNELFDPQQGFRNIKLRELKDALDDDVFKAAGQDVFEQARKAKRDFEKGLTRAKVSKFDQRKANLVRDILEDKVDPDRLVDQVVFGKKWRAADLKQLKDYISTDEAGRQAFNDLRAETLESIKAKSFIGPDDAQGFTALSKDKLEKAISSVGDQKMSILFTPPERKFLKDMLAVSKLREPVRGTATGRGPSAQAIQRLEGKLKTFSIFGSLVSAIGVDARGRAALKAAPRKLAQRVIPSPPRQLAAQAAGVGAVTAGQEQNNGQ